MGNQQQRSDVCEDKSSSRPIRVVNILYEFIDVNSGEELRHILFICDSYYKPISFHTPEIL